MNKKKPVAQVSTDFVPRRHGFRFVNSFSIQKSEFRLGKGKLRFGLCGGMCLSALRKYNDAARMPTRRTPPVAGTPLFKELFLCQTETLLPATWVRFLKWQLRPARRRISTRHTIGSSTYQQWRRKLRSRINKGAPTILGLIRANGPKADPSNNHQVLAIGYTFDAGAKDLTLSVYDPNHPGAVVKLTMNFKNPGTGIRAAQSTGEKLRGFFVVDEK